MLHQRKSNIFNKIILFLFIPHVLFSNTYKYYKIEFNDNRKEIVKVVNFTSEHISILKNNKIKKISNKTIKKYIVIDKNDYKFKRVIVLTEKKYAKGYVVYQDREKLSISINIDNPKLLTFKSNKIVDIVNAENFDYEMSKNEKTALLYSSLFPGLGQIYTSNRTAIGVCFMSSFILSGSGSYYAYRQSKSYYKQYEQSRYKNSQYYNKYKTYSYASIALAGLSAAIYIYNLIDSYNNFEYKYKINKEYMPINQDKDNTNEFKKSTFFSVSYSFLF